VTPLETARMTQMSSHMQTRPNLASERRSAFWPETQGYLQNFTPHCCVSREKNQPCTERHVILAPARNQLLLESTVMKLCKVTMPANMKITVLRGWDPAVFINLKESVTVPSNTTTFLFRNYYIFSEYLF
jgi:hypothetical protein